MFSRFTTALRKFHAVISPPRETGEAVGRFAPPTIATVGENNSPREELTQTRQLLQTMLKAMISSSGWQTEARSIPKPDESRVP